jgi:hypothetical protein
MDGRTGRIAGPCGAQLCGVVSVSELTAGHRPSPVTRNIVKWQG